jgi:hypothetical protein
MPQKEEKNDEEWHGHEKNDTRNHRLSILHDLSYERNGSHDRSTKKTVL